MNARCGLALRRFLGEHARRVMAHLHTVSCFRCFLNSFLLIVLHGVDGSAAVHHVRSGGSGGVLRPSAERAGAVSAGAGDLSA